MTRRQNWYLALLLLSWLAPSMSFADDADLILHHGKIATVDAKFTIHEALAVKDGRILQVGTSADVLSLRAPRTQVINLAGKLVIPGLIDSHVHPASASMIEFDHPVPEMHTIQDVLDYVKSRAALLEAGQWIEVKQVFITRLKEQRYPTRAELDAAAPQNPVVFSTGPDASLSTLALQLSGIDKDFAPTGRGFAEKDSKTGEPTGILRSCGRYIKSKSPEKKATEEQRVERLQQLLRDYNSVGITAIADRGADESAAERYGRLAESKQLTVRVAMSRVVGTDRKTEAIQEDIRKVAAHPLVKGNDLARIVGIKTFLDGGMLTGSAYMSQPWGVSDIYSIRDPQYRGVLFIQPDVLEAIVQTTVDAGLQFTAHTVGDGAVQNLLDAYAAVDKKTPLRATRPCITHSNFMSQQSIERAGKLGVVLDIQPAWLWLDGKTLLDHFGYDRLRYFQPLKTIFATGVIAGGGSDHMQRIGSLRSLNPYNPFLGLWVCQARRPRGLESPLHEEEALTREQALRFYTANNAYLMFAEDKIGTLEAGKFADFVVLDTDLLTCPLEGIRDAKALATYLGGKRVYSSDDAK